MTPPVVNLRRARIVLFGAVAAVVALAALDTWAVDSIFHGIYTRVVVAALSSFTGGLVIGSAVGRFVLGRWLLPRDFAQAVRYLIHPESIRER